MHTQFVPVIVESTLQMAYQPHVGHLPEMLDEVKQAEDSYRPKYKSGFGLKTLIVHDMADLQGSELDEHRTVLCGPCLVLPYNFEANPSVDASFSEIDPAEILVSHHGKKSSEPLKGGEFFVNIEGQRQVIARVRDDASGKFIDSRRSNGLQLPALHGQTEAQLRLGFAGRHMHRNEDSFKAVHKCIDAVWWASTLYMTPSEFNIAALCYVASIQ